MLTSQATAIDARTKSKHICPHGNNRVQTTPNSRTRTNPSRRKEQRAHTASYRTVASATKWGRSQRRQPLRTLTTEGTRRPGSPTRWSCRRENCWRSGSRRTVAGTRARCAPASTASPQCSTLEAASTHKSAKTHADTVLVTRDLWPSDPKINRFPGLIVGHFYIKFGDPRCIGFSKISCAKTDIYRQVMVKINPGDRKKK